MLENNSGDNQSSAPANQPSQQDTPAIEAATNAANAGQSGTDANAGSSQAPALAQDLVDLAKGSMYGFTQQQLDGYKSDDDLRQAMLQFDMQPPQVGQPQYAQPMQQPVMQQQPIQQQPHNVQPQMMPQEQFAQQQQQVPQMPQLDPESMDETTYQAFQYLTAQNQQMQDMYRQQQQMMESMAYQQYQQTMNPLVEQLNDPRFSQTNQFGSSQRDLLLQTVEQLRHQRQMMGIVASDADLVQAAYNLYQTQIGSAPQGLGDQVIGSPGQQIENTPPNPEQNAQNAIAQFTGPDDPVMKANAAIDKQVLDGLPD